MSRTCFVVLAALSLGLGLSACGGSDKNAPPTASDVAITLSEDTPAQGTFVGSDPEGDTLSAAIVTAPPKGSVVVSGSNPLAFTYTPRLNQNGADSFTYRVTDGRSYSLPATVNITILPVNDPPALQQSLTTDEDVPATAVLITDPDGDTITSQILVGPAHGTLTADPANPGAFTYTPNHDFSGADSFQLQASDPSAAISSGTVTVTVRPVNDAPIAVADSVRTVQGKSAQFQPLANDSDVDGDALTVTITSAPSDGTATVNADGSIQYTPSSGFVGNTSLEYQVRDPGGLTARATVPIAVGLTSAVLYLDGPDVAAAKDLYFADGTRNFRVNAPLRSGERIVTVRPATRAPVVFYTTDFNFVRHLFRVDLRQAGVAREIEQPIFNPGVGEFAFDATGSKVAYGYQSRLKFVDFAAPGIVRELGDGQRGLFMNPSGTRVYYNGLTANPYLASGALFSVETSGASPPAQITSTITPPDSTGTVIYLSRDEHRLYYSVSLGLNSRIAGVDPDVPGSDFTIQEGPAQQTGWNDITQDESTYWARSLGSSTEDYYAVKIGNPGTSVSLTAGTSAGQIYARAMQPDGSHFFYSRSNIGGLASRLYRVDMSNPSVSTLIAAPTPATHFGVESLSLANNGQNLVYTTMDLVPNSGGGFSSGGSGLFFLDLATPDLPRLLKQFVGVAETGLRAPDDSFVVVSGALDEVSFIHDIYVLNLRSLGPPTRINAGVAEQPMLIANF